VDPETESCSALTRTPRAGLEVVTAAEPSQPQGANLVTKLSDTQLVLLSNAAKREDGALTRSSKMKPDTAEQAAQALLSRKLIKSIPKSGALPLWKKGSNDDLLTLVITSAGLEAIGIEAGGARNQPDAAAPKQRRAKAKRPTRVTEAAGAAKPTAQGTRPNTKIAKVIEMMRKPGGVTLKAIMSATDWQAHSVRGAISGAIKKKLGLKVVSEMRGDERTYRIGG